MKIEGNAFIVTGGASGLGEGTARMLRANGGAVVIADMQADKGTALASEIGGVFVRCDVSDETDGQAAVAAALKLGKLAGLVNCAGIAPAERTVGKNGPHALALFGKTVMVNLIGTFNMIRLAADAMAKNEPEATGERGVIVSTASVAAYDGQIGQAAYSASKGGVRRARSSSWRPARRPPPRDDQRGHRVDAGVQAQPGAREDHQRHGGRARGRRGRPTAPRRRARS
jgi:NAD(P)-dependent dehydrogenase (short-subunit alcohol dehydrogenase family)